MKRLVAIMLMLVMMCGNALAVEYTFDGVPFGTNIPFVCEHFGKEVTDDIDTYNESDTTNVVYLNRKRHISEFGAKSMFDDDYDYGYTENGCKIDWWPDKMCVAEYDIKTIELQFVFGINENAISDDMNNAEFYSGKYIFEADDYAEAYKDLKDKLIWLYGEPTAEEYWDNKALWQEDILGKYVLWEGDNDTAILLYAEYNYDFDTTAAYELSIEYGKLGMAERFDLVDKIMKQAERNKKYNAENTSGL